MNLTQLTLGDLTQQLGIQLPSAEQPLNLTWRNENDVRVWVKRDDLVHPVISGNKWRKLSQTLLRAAHSPPSKIISFGGGHSNHLHALAYSCQRLAIPLLAIVRGDYSQHMTPMLSDIKHWGAEIEWVNKITYAKRADASYLDQLNAEHPNSLIIPEGGSQLDALNGVASIVAELTRPYDIIVTPVASGGTMAGLIQGTHNSRCDVLGLGVLKGHDYLQELVTRLLPSEIHQLGSSAQEPTEQKNWQINSDFHFGGYAKKTPELVTFCEQFEQDYQIPIEPIYSGKLFWGLRQLIENKSFPPGCKILALHTGGLQGKRVQQPAKIIRNQDAVD
ncbi:1-aminocyclopropane-1-carboxylate deaminase/D-cysteine desulfhydrase [Aliiglaciecola sp. SL4]|uniref:1-aminocyclopropane-1-carboxylate deaminase/D-cysteine desulfhydrase n=1 Tax=Aliiglaciecola sp. SL4 TaxID=3239806 RepID=UPI00355B81D0